MTLFHRTLTVLVGCVASLSCSALMERVLAQDPARVKQMQEAAEKAAAAGEVPQAPPQGEPPKEGAPAKTPGKADAKPGEKAAEKTEPARARRKPAKPADPEELKARPDDDGRITFSFKGQDWEDVLEWLAEVSNMSLQMEEVPPGFLNLTSRGRYTVEQIQDLINSTLINKGFTILRNGDVLLVSKLDKLDKSLVPRVEPDELDQRGTYEFVKCFFDLKTLIAETTAEELKPMLSPAAKITAMKSTNRLDIVETAGNLRRIRDFLAEEQSDRGKENVLREFKLKNVRAAEVLDTLHTVLGLKKPGPSVALTGEQIAQMQQQFMQAAQQAAQGAAKGPGGKADREVFLAINKAENSILANAPPDKMAIIEQAVKAMDIVKNRSESLLSNLPRLRSYKLTSFDPMTIVKVLEDLGNLDPQSRLEVDARSRTILAFATPIDHITIQAIVDKIDGTGRKFEVVQLYVLEADMVAGSIEFLMRGPEDKNRSRSYSPFYYDFGFGPSRGSQEKDPNDQLQVEADTEHNRLLIRATDAEMKEIRDLLAKLGELPEDMRGRQTMRVVPMSPDDMQKLIERIQHAWPSVAPNPLKVAPVETPEQATDEEDAEPAPRRRKESRNAPATGSERTIAPRSRETEDRLAADDSAPYSLLTRLARSTAASPGHPALSISALESEQEAGNQDPARDERELNRAGFPGRLQRPQRPGARTAPPPIAITPGPHGLIISSEDTEALDQLERVIAELTPAQRVTSKLFYLKNSFCKDVADVLKDVFREGESPRSPNPFSDDMYYYYRYGAGSRETSKERGRLSKRKQLKFIPEPMTNTILVLGADTNQLADVERLIKVYDEGIRPDSNSVRITRQLSFRYTTAKEVAEVVKDVFRDLLSPNDKSMARPGSPQQQQEQGRAMYSTTYIFGGDSEKDNARKFKGLLSLGIDDRSNTLIVSAPKDLMNIISQMADDLDRAAGESRGVVQVLNLGTATGAVQQILSNVAKPQIINNQPAQEAGEKGAVPKQPPPVRTETFITPN